MSMTGWVLTLAGLMAVGAFVLVLAVATMRLSGRVRRAELLATGDRQRAMMPDYGETPASVPAATPLVGGGGSGAPTDARAGQRARGELEHDDAAGRPNGAPTERAPADTRQGRQVRVTNDSDTEQEGYMSGVEVRHNEAGDSYELGQEIDGAFIVFSHVDGSYVAGQVEAAKQRQQAEQAAQPAQPTEQGQPAGETQAATPPPA